MSNRVLERSADKRRVMRFHTQPYRAAHAAQGKERRLTRGLGLMLPRSALHLRGHLKWFSLVAVYTMSIAKCFDVCQ